MKTVDEIIAEFPLDRQHAIHQRADDLIAEERARRATRVEKYARAICRVFVIETARVLRIKVTETWIQTRVDSRWKEYIEQAQAAIKIADIECDEAYESGSAE